MSKYKPPFPWFGGKSRAADLIWERLGAVDNYVEPFFGSGAILLARPSDPGTETVNDKDAFVANFWRAVQADPNGVAFYADWPVNEADLAARHYWLVTEGLERLGELLAEPTGFDAQIAGWWVWGQSAWIAGGWCSGEGPWVVTPGGWLKRERSSEDDEPGIGHVLPQLRNKGEGVNRPAVGVNRPLPHFGDAGQGVHRKIPDLGNPGKGVHRKLPQLRNAGEGVHRPEHPHLGHLKTYMQDLALRLRYVRVACGDWARVLGPSVTFRHGLTGVVLDPPYGAGNVDYSSGGNACLTVAQEARAWAIENGANPDLRIALCGYEGQFEMPEDWSVESWVASGGYASAAEGDTEGKENRFRERVWFSPHCLAPGPQLEQVSLFGD